MEGRRPRAMLLEGNAALREILGEALAELGFEVLGAGTRREALGRLLDDPDLDLLVVDLVDESSGGERLLSFLADQHELAGIPLVVMTDGVPPPAVAPDAVQLAKPFDVDALGRAVLEATRRRGGRAGAAQHP